MFVLYGSNFFLKRQKAGVNTILELNHVIKSCVNSKIELNLFLELNHVADIFICVYITVNLL